MLAGQSGRRDHVAWNVLDVAWRKQWEYSVELTSSIFALNKREPYAVEAWKLAIWMTERPFWTKVIYGDKDTIRYAFLVFGIPFEMIVEPPGQILFTKDDPKKNHGTRRHLINKFRDKVVSIDQIKFGQAAQIVDTENWVVVNPLPHIYPEKEDNSYCAPEYDRYGNSGKHFDWDNKDLKAEVSRVLRMIKAHSE
mmetsp:Transcript_22823/g.68737  ORF Transcript_22823/g.68737 Transcript_22823/m.68737 type:complete len:195 (+) Transcript_22823:2-586(+)